MHVITCCECGSERQTRWRNTKYCLVCRYLRNTKYIRDREIKKDCVECDSTFLPLKRDDAFCPECAMVSQAHPRGTCGLCKSTDQPLLARGIKICHACAYSIEQRDLMIKALGKKKRERQEHPYVIPEEELTPKTERAAEI